MFLLYILQTRWGFGVDFVIVGGSATKSLNMLDALVDIPASALPSGPSLDDDTAFLKEKTYYALLAPSRSVRGTCSEAA
ncbi:hypothetical protein IFR05_017319, partial [Cadophora sp. M221]